MSIEPLPLTKTLIQGAWECVLCHAKVVQPGTAHFCTAEARIREIVREEFSRFVPHPTGDGT